MQEIDDGSLRGEHAHLVANEMAAAVAALRMVEHQTGGAAAAVAMALTLEVA